MATRKLTTRKLTVFKGIDHPKVVARAEAEDRRSDARFAAVDKGFNQIDNDLMRCRATLMCAVEALQNAQDGGIGERDDTTCELEASAVSVVRHCSEELFRIECAFDRLNLDYTRARREEGAAKEPRS